MVLSTDPLIIRSSVLGFTTKHEIQWVCPFSCVIYLKFYKRFEDQIVIDESLEPEMNCDFCLKKLRVEIAPLCFFLCCNNFNSFFKYITLQTKLDPVTIRVLLVFMACAKLC